MRIWTVPILGFVGMVGSTQGVQSGKMNVLEGIEVNPLFGPELPGQYKHPASIAELGNGDLYVAYYCGSGEYGEDTAVYGSRLAKGSNAWERPKVIADTPWRSEGNPVVWQGPDDLVWLFYVNRYGDTWSDSLIKVKVSTDFCKSWSDPFMLTLEKGMMVRNQPLLLADGQFLLPVYHETGHDREVVGPDTTALFFRYDPNSHEWTETNRISSRLGCLQPAVAKIEGDHLVAYCRRGGGYMPRKDGWMVRTESRDGGKTWTPGKETQFPNPNSAVEFLRLDNGHHLLIYNDHMFDRQPLSAAISVDNDETYPYRTHLIQGKGPYAYPYAIQSRDGKIHLIFTSDERTRVYHAVFEEEVILKSGNK